MSADLVAEDAAVPAVRENADVRRQVAHDLHDGAQQRLVTLALLIKLARDHDSIVDADVRGLLGRAVEQAHAAIDELRHLATGLYPSVLTFSGYGAAVDDLAAASPVPVLVDITLPHRYPEWVEAQLYFVTVEAITNAIKHADAQLITVAATSNGEVLTLTIRDDGVGTAMARTAGHGMVSMRSRAQALGGHLRLASEAGAGTTVVLEIPLPTPS